MTTRWRRAGIPGAVATALLACGVEGAIAQEWRMLIGERAQRSVVAVIPDLPRSQMNMEEPEGTGFAVGDGTHILTAAHVLGNAKMARIRMPGGEMADAEIVVRDGDTDLALLSIEERLPPLLVKPEIRTGSDVCVAGNAFGLGISLTCGIVSATGMRGIGFNRIEDFVQTDAAVNPGMSGAPLFGRDGHVSGIVTAIFTKGSDGNLGVNFASSVRLIEAFLADAQDGSLDRRSPGLLLRPDMAAELTGREYPRIVRVIEGSPEDTAGLDQGDRLVAINDLAIRGQPDYLLAVMLYGAPDTHVYSIIRDGSAMTIPVNFDRTREEGND